jgi:hypothetical protein
MSAQDVKKINTDTTTDSNALRNQVIEPESVANGPVLILLIVLLFSVLGGMYYWFRVLNNNTPVINPAALRPTAAQNNEPESTTAEAQVEALGAVSTSDEVPAIEADVESTNLDSLDAELDAIEKEIDAALVEESETAGATP